MSCRVVAIAVVLAALDAATAALMAPAPAVPCAALAHRIHATRAEGRRCPQCAIAATATSPSDASSSAQSPRRGGEPTRAKLSITKRRASKNWRVVSLYRDAQRMMAGGDDEGARDLLEECLRLDERDAHAWLSLARLEARTRDVSEARLAFERASGACPGNVRIVHANAVFEQKAGDAHSARALFARASELEPRSAYVAHAWGLLEEGAGNLSAARAIYRGLLDGRPDAAQVAIAWAALEASDGALATARRGSTRPGGAGWRWVTCRGSAAWTGAARHRPADVAAAAAAAAAIGGGGATAGDGDEAERTTGAEGGGGGMALFARDAVRDAVDLLPRGRHESAAGNLTAARPRPPRAIHPPTRRGRGWPLRRSRRRRRRWRRRAGRSRRRHG